MTGSGDFSIGSRERAGALARDILSMDRPHELERIIADAIAQAIDEAVKAEREACTKLIDAALDNQKRRHDFVMMGALALPALLRELTLAIRARGAQ